LRISIIFSLALLIGLSAQAAPVPQADLAAEVDGPYDVTFSLSKLGPQQQVLLDWQGGQGLVVTFDAKATTVREVTSKGTRTLAILPAARPGPQRIKRRYPVLEIIPPTYPGIFRAYSRRSLSGVAAPATGATLTDFAVQPVDLIEFDDDFFDPSGAESLWEPISGKWAVGTYRDPLKALENRPIAAAWYQCNETSVPVSVSLTGQSFWDSYHVRVAARASADVSSGIVFGASDGQRFSALRVKPLPDGQGMAELVSGRAGPSSATAPVSWRPGNWYELAAEVAGGRLICYVQGREVFSKPWNGLGGGKAGLCMFGHGEARFDDFAVTSVQRLQDRPDWQQECWEALSGRWTMGGKTGAQGSGKPFGIIRRVTDFVPDMVGAEVVPAMGALGVALNWQGKSGYVLEVTRQGKYSLSRLDEGKKSALASGQVPRADSYRVELAHREGRLEANVGATTQALYDLTYSGGSSGCCASGGGLFWSFATGVEQDSLTSISTVTGTPSPMPGENSDSQRFVLGYLWQPTGGNWTGVGSEGDKRLSGKPWGQAPGALWYYQPCPGEAVMGLEDLKLNEGGKAGVAIGCDRRDVMSGYRAEIEGTALRLYRADNLMTESKLPKPPTKLRLWRDGRHIVAMADARGVSFEDSQPLTGSLCAAYATGTGVTVQQVTISHRRARYYSFRSEETDWQPMLGEWGTHTGMACIPWDYWYTAKGSPQALAFNVRPQSANLHADLWVGEYSEGYAEDREHKHFPYRDLSIITSATGEELDGGYRFLIGAESGAVTRLLRKGQVVAETRDPRVAIRMGGHCNTPREVHVVIHQEGGVLTLEMDGRRALEYTDPQPLPGGRLGIGTTNCIANFRDLWVAEL
jgi:hypothetical protein